MASITDLLITGAQQTASQTPDYSKSFAQGAELAQNLERLKQNREELELRKEEAAQQKLTKIGSLYDTAAKMPEGKGRNAFLKSYIPNAIKALGFGDKIDPTVQEMLSATPQAVSYIQAKLTDQSLALPDVYEALANPEKMATLMSKTELEKFGGAEAIKSALADYPETLQKAYTTGITEAGKSERASTMAGVQETKSKREDVDNLRKELTSNPVVKDTNEIGSSYARIKEVFTGPPSPAGDVSGVYAYMKMLDPRSTVREGEQAQAREATGVPSQILNLYNRLVTGQSLTAEQRKDFYTRASAIYKAQQSKQKNVVKQFSTVAKKRGYNPDDITAGIVEAPAAPTKKITFKDLTPAEQSQAIKGYMQKYKVDEAKAKQILGGM